jgi:hypothetical protein
MKSARYTRTLMVGLLAFVCVTARPNVAGAQAGDNFMVWWDDHVAGPYNDFVNAEIAALGINDGNHPGALQLLGMANAGIPITAADLTISELGVSETLKLVYDAYSVYKVGDAGVRAGEAINEGRYGAALDATTYAALNILVAKNWEGAEPTFENMFDQLFADTFVDVAGEFISRTGGYFAYADNPQVPMDTIPPPPPPDDSVETTDEYYDIVSEDCQCSPVDPHYFENADGSVE